MEPDITGTPPPVALGTTSNALFDTKDVGTEKPITFETDFDDSGPYDLFAPYNTTPGTYVTRANITPAPLTITANDGTKVFGETYPLSRQAFTSVELVNAETVTGVTLTSPGAVATASVDGSPHAITPADATGCTFSPGNYNINYVNGALFVSSTSVGPVAATPVYLAPVYPTSDDSDQESTTQTSEGLELTFATAAATMPTLQLERVGPLPESDLLTSPSDTYVPPVYEPRQDRF